MYCTQLAMVAMAANMSFDEVLYLTAQYPSTSEIAPFPFTAGITSPEKLRSAVFFVARMFGIISCI